MRMRVLVAIALFSAAPLTGQDRFEIGPLVGLYLPVGNFPAAPYYSTRLPRTPADLGGPALGAQTRVWLGRRLALQADGSIAFGSVSGGTVPSGGTSGAFTTRVSAGTLQLLLATRAGGSWRFWASAGGGLVRYGGEAYAPYASGTRAALAFGGGILVPVHRRLNLSAGLTGLSYRLDVRDSQNVRLESGRQLDLRLQTVLSYVWR